MTRLALARPCRLIYLAQMRDPYTLTDDELLALYQEYGTDAGDEFGDELAAEIERRNLDV